MNHQDNSAIDWLPALLQIADSAFPTGGYAHSLGFESLANEGHLTDETTLLHFLREHTLPTLEHTDLPLVRAAHEAAHRNDLPALLAIDAVAAALKLTHELREASRRTGRQRLAALTRVRPSPLLLAFSQACDADSRSGHHVTVWAAACAPVPVRAAMTAWLTQSLAALCLTTPKLLRIGQEGAQRVLASCLESAAGSVERAMAIPLDDAGWFDPVLDLASMRHEIANARLFIS